jgi:hypothetical protein
VAAFQGSKIPSRRQCEEGKLSIPIVGAALSCRSMTGAHTRHLLIMRDTVAGTVIPAATKQVGLCLQH